MGNFLSNNDYAQPCPEVIKSYNFIGYWIF